MVDMNMIIAKNISNALKTVGKKQCELANAMKPMVIPGEVMTVTLIKQGKESGQAVAYLDDGTMIVVEDGRKKIGQTLDINVTSVLQTAAGRMIFGKVRQ